MPGLGGARRAPDRPRARRRSCRRRRSSKQPLVDDELDARGAERVGVPERERRRARRASAGRATATWRTTLVGGDLVEVDAVADQVVDRERLRVDDLDRRVDDGDAVALDAPDDRDAAPADLGVQERVDDVDRDLVAQLGAAVRVADDQDVRHGVSLAALPASATHRSRWVGCGRGWRPRRRAEDPSRRGLGSRSRGRRARVGPARDDAAARHRGARGAARDARPARSTSGSSTTRSGGCSTRPSRSSSRSRTTPTTAASSG